MDTDADARSSAFYCRYCTKQTVPISSAVALSPPPIDSRLLAGSATTCSSEAHISGEMSLPCRWQRRNVIVCASEADLDGQSQCGIWSLFGQALQRLHSATADSLRHTRRWLKG